MRSQLVLMAATILLCVAAPLQAQDTPVMRVIVVQTDNPAAYTKEVLETGQAHLKRLEGTGNLRIWKAKFAGSNAGSVVVSIEYPSLAALAADDKKMAADAAFGTWVRSLDKMRKIVSDSLYSEAK